ncbi:galactose-1-phosphate uridylyltransferase [Streptomyces litchfieldiae]|uniref:Galactose-1-phosphate uridylyltransferase n=1 Tax=Streptomyces litchfieldiae TaxID=3075543 RepID=A0ABU2MZA2_9ACTN|nr:galactose-1-phosphate uridylyltransferase [Streptomyces sp. DSM 44938]MDT0346987.1 galactose-1-phosphate uridylyltransferase [Streptomyces sp. DSM 44938]
MKRTTTRLADGRELIYYDNADDAVRDAHDRRPLPPVTASSEVRHNALLGERVGYAAHRQSRTYHPPADQCPLCPSQGERLSEIPAPDYEVAVFENRFPSFSGEMGRCEVVCFTSEHDASFARLTGEQAALVLYAWTDRTAELSQHPGVKQVYCFENRGTEIGVTLAHPHGQIYGYPFITPVTERVLRNVAEHKRRTGGNLFDELLEAERADGRRVVAETAHWTAFVPHAARWPYEVHLYPRRRVPDLMALTDEERAEFPGIYLELLRRFDRIFGPDAPPTPYISGWHQAPFGIEDRGDFALHLELFTIRRSPGKLKYLAGSESGMGAFVSDVLPEAAADRLREVAS